MMTKWRVIKKAVNNGFSYVGLEFNLEDGEATMIKINDKMTAIRKRTTSQFEALENSEWISLPTEDAPDLLRDFNDARKGNGKDFITEDEVLNLLYRINSL